MALIIPDADEIAYYATGYMTGYNLDTLDSLSPTLPMNFDRNYLPSILLPNTENLCEK